jgi:hypothetical protein
MIGTAVLASLLALQSLPIVLASGANSRSAGGGSAASVAQNVSILERRLVGVFETTTITSRLPKALQSWLRENGFIVTTNTEPVIDSYAKDGWVFVAVKVRRDKPEKDTSTPHPLSFTFKTDKPVYPMRLTGVDNGPLQVELYVFGPSRATAPNFKTVRCTRAEYPDVPPRVSYGWRHWPPAKLVIVHPLLRKWLADTPVATKLSAILSPAEMRNDVWLEWSSFAESGNQVFSRQGALITGANWGSGFFATFLALAVVGRWKSSRGTTPSGNVLGLATLVAIVCGAMTWWVLPKTEVRLMKASELMGKPQSIIYHLSWGLRDSDSPSSSLSLAIARAEVRTTINVAFTNAPYWRQWVKESDWSNWQNYYLGGPLREEDSPGNYLFRENNGRIQFIGYDALGAEHVFHDWAVPAN